MQLQLMRDLVKNTRSIPIRSVLVQSSQKRPLVTVHEDTIAAIVTGPALGAVSIVRISGQKAVDIAQSIFRSSSSRSPRQPWVPKSHRVYHGHVTPPASDTTIDEILLLPMLSPRSYTMEDVIELHTHGGSICARRVLQACIEAGARRARPGEFTLRAFLNGRLDLAQAESVQELVSARSPAAADAALAGLQGGVGDVVRRMRLEVVELVAEVEARLDFDENLGVVDPKLFLQRLDKLHASLRDARDTAVRGKLLRSGLQIALVGRPNVGKSSLLNAWSVTDRAIVTDIAGTTRDIVSIDVLAAEGVPLTLLDTAGLRETNDVVEKVGVERSRRAARDADAVVFVMDAKTGWSGEDEDIFQQLVQAWGDLGKRPPCILCVNKIDGANQQQQQQQQEQSIRLPINRGDFASVVETSATLNRGMEALESAVLAACAASKRLSSGPAAWAVNERQAEALSAATIAVERSIEAVKSELPMDFWTIDLRQALVSLGEVTGDEVTEEVLDQIFSRFCIGK